MLARQIDQFAPGRATASATPTCCSSCSCLATAATAVVGVPLILAATTNRAPRLAGRAGTPWRTLAGLVIVALALPLTGLGLGAWLRSSPGTFGWVWLVLPVASITIMTLGLVVARRDPWLAAGASTLSFAALALLFVIELVGLVALGGVGDGERQAYTSRFPVIELGFLVACSLICAAVVGLGRRHRRNHPATSPDHPGATERTTA